MWDQVKKMPPIMVGQIIFNYLDLKSIVRLETALVSSEKRQIMSSYLYYFSKVDIIINIPEENLRLKWFQAHDFLITRAIVHLDKINATFQTHMISNIELVDNRNPITSSTLSNLPDKFYEKVVSIYFVKKQTDSILEELFSHLHNLREVKVCCNPDGWILNALRILHTVTNNNILIETIDIWALTDLGYSVAEIAKYCPKLQSLTVDFKLSEDSLIALSTFCPLLKELKVRSMPRTSTEQIAAICAPALSCIHSICTPLEDYYDVHDYERTVPYLTELRILRAEGGHDIVLLPLISQYCMKLEELQITTHSNITPIQVLQLVKNCQQLKSITITLLDFYSEDVVIGLIERCPNLQKLSFCGNPYNQNGVFPINDSILLALSKHCPQLEEIEARGYLRITEAIVVYLVQQCKKLYKLRLPMNCLYEDTVFGVPVKVKKGSDTMITYNIDRKL